MLDLKNYKSSLLVSGTTNRILKLGERVEPAPDVPGDTARRRFGRAGDLSEQLGDGGDSAAAGGSGAAAAAAGGKSKIGSNITIKDLIDQGLVKPGPDALSVTYKNKVTLGTLLPDGTIEYGGQTFSSASAFSVHVKRLTTPSKQGDDGWRSVHVSETGVPLHDLRSQLLLRLGQEAAAAGAGRQRGVGRPARGRPASYREDELDEEIEEEQQPAAAEPAEVHWVQCSRCERWRVVPDEHWGPIASADEDADWFCEMAPWDVAKHEPFEPACQAS